MQTTNITIIFLVITTIIIATFQVDVEMSLILTVISDSSIGQNTSCSESYMLRCSLVSPGRYFYRFLKYARVI
jgi:hypothetical protein